MLRARALFLATLVAGVAAPVLVAAEPDAAACPGYRVEPGTGPICPREGGLWEVFGREGQSLGFIHGQDPVRAAPADGGLDVTPAAPTCATDTSTEYHSLVIYARASNDLDRYNQMLPTIRSMVNNTNGHLREEGAIFNVPINYRFACVGGLVEVRNEALPTSMSSASFSSIVQDLQSKGYTSRRIKYVVWYDDTGACSCAGQGHIYNDDSASVNNYNNGNPSAVPMFGVTFGYSDYTTMMHEHGHNLGAVQHSAPDASGGYHCNDGQDIMCYADGGPTSNYVSSVCAQERFDCGHDSYFHPYPAAGSWLATHWNLAGQNNRFIIRGNVPPVLQSFSCSPVAPAVGATVTCSVSATDDSSGVSYSIDWGDGSPATRVPASGTVAPGTTQTATHAYTAAATRTASATATDNDATPLTSAPLSYTLYVGSTGVPVMQSLSCSPNPATTDDTVTCTFRADDESSGIYYTVNWGDGSATTRVPLTGFVAPGSTQSATHKWSGAGTYSVSVTATDNASPSLTSLALVRDQSIVLPPCNHDYSGQMRLGVLGNEEMLGPGFQGVGMFFVNNLPFQCQNEPFTLSSTSLGADFHLCWYRGPDEISCFETAGGEEGIMPATADRARIQLYTGVQAGWRLSLGD